MKTIGFGTLAALTLSMASMACGSPASENTSASSSKLKVTGSVDTTSRTLDNASAVAMGSDGRTFSAYLDSRGKFSLELPVGHTYRILIANSTSAGNLRTIGHLVNTTSNGRSAEIAVRRGGAMNLGKLHPAGTSTGTVSPRCGCSADDEQDQSSSPPDKSSADGYPSEDNGDDLGDDYQTQQKDGDVDRVCDDASSDVDLVAENTPGDVCAKGDSDEDAPTPPGKSCTDASDTSAPTKGSAADDPADETDTPTKGSGDACTCSSQCGGSSCVASTCSGSSTSTPSKGGGSSGRGGK